MSYPTQTPLVQVSSASLRRQGSALLADVPAANRQLMSLGRCQHRFTDIMLFRKSAELMIIRRLSRVFLIDTANLESGDPPSPTEDSNTTILANLFFGLQFFGLGGITVILFSALISRTITKRHPTWKNFMVSWIISCSSYILLVGRPIHSQPDFGLCLTQAALIYAVPTLSSWATLALVIYVLLTVRSILSFTHNSISRTWTVILVIGPYIGASGMLAGSLVVGLHDPNSVKRTATGMYCHLATRIMGKISAISVTLAMITTFVLEVVVAVNLRRHWLHVRRDGRSLSIIFRVMGFGVFGIVAIVLGLVFFFTDAREASLNIVIALIPVSAVLVFGTQRDIFRAWTPKFWKPQLPMALKAESEDPTKIMHYTSTVNGSEDPIFTARISSSQYTRNNDSEDTLPVAIGTAL